MYYLTYPNNSNNMGKAELDMRGGSMTQTQVKEYLENAKEVTRKAIVSRVEARKLLVKGGFCTQKGELKKIYRAE